MRLLHAKHKLKANDVKGAKRMISTVAYMYVSVLSAYMGTGNDKDEKFLQTIHVRENVSCLSKIQLPYCTVDIYPKIGIHCGVCGTTQTLGDSVEYHPKYLECKDKPDILRRNRKIVTEKDLGKKRGNM